MSIRQAVKEDVNTVKIGEAIEMNRSVILELPTVGVQTLYAGRGAIFVKN
jgi:hypothetical protein